MNMYKFRPIAALIFCILCSSLSFAEDAQVQAQQDLAKIQDLKLQLFTQLDSGDISSGTFDEKTEVNFANTEIAVGNYYLTQGERKYAIISGIIARKILQRLYGPNDPRVIPAYSLLVDAYTSSVDVDNPNTDASNADKAKLYRQLIDHIHAE